MVILIVCLADVLLLCRALGVRCVFGMRHGRRSDELLRNDFVDHFTSFWLKVQSRHQFASALDKHPVIVARWGANVRTTRAHLQLLRPVLCNAHPGAKRAYVCTIVPARKIERFVWKYEQSPEQSPPNHMNYNGFGHG